MPGLRDIFRNEDAQRRAYEARKAQEQQQIIDKAAQQRQGEQAKLLKQAEVTERNQGLVRQAGEHYTQSGADEALHEIAERRNGRVSHYTTEYDPTTLRSAVTWNVVERSSPRFEGSDETGNWSYSIDTIATHGVEVATDPNGNMQINGRTVRRGNKKDLDRALGKAYKWPRIFNRRKERS